MFKRIIVPGILILSFLAAVGAAGYFYWQVRELKKDPQVAVQAEIDQLVLEVGELIVLPTGETPTVATVSDPELLREQAFFANSKAGDKVLLYTNAKKAILYDPIAHKIIEVAPINIGDEGGTATTTPEPAVAGQAVEQTPTPTPEAPVVTPETIPSP
jgi:hypothetical protein